jgi:hypothetical protein
MDRVLSRRILWRLILGALLALAVARPMRDPVLKWGMLVGLIGIWVALRQRTLSARVVGVRCPACRRRTMSALSRARLYAECWSCGGRFKRRNFLTPWVKALDPEDQRVFVRGESAGTWLGYATPSAGETTTGRLLGNQRLRHGASPAESITLNESAEASPAQAPSNDGQASSRAQ